VGETVRADDGHIEREAHYDHAQGREWAGDRDLEILAG